MRQGVPITLTAIEVKMAALVGAERYMESVDNQRRDAHGYPQDRDGLADHILGACGEAAVGQCLGRYWGGDVGSFKRADIGASVQVRTRAKHDWDLIVRPNDDPNHIYILVTGCAPTFTIWGWIRGAEARNPDWLDTYGNRPSAWFVPKAALRPLRVAAQSAS